LFIDYYRKQFNFILLQHNDDIDMNLVVNLLTVIKFNQ